MINTSAHDSWTIIETLQTEGICIFRYFSRNAVVFKMPRRPRIPQVTLEEDAPSAQSSIPIPIYHTQS